MLRHLNRVQPFARQRLANDPVTAAYIAAAMRLVRRHLGPNATRGLIDPEDDEGVERPLLGFLSQRAVAAEVANNPDPFPKLGNVSTLRSTWKSQSDFIADLLAFAGWAIHYPAQYHEDVAANAGRLLEGPHLIAAVHALAYWDSSTLVNAPEVRLGFVMAATADGDDQIREVYAQNMRETLRPWKEIYAALIRERKLQLRPGTTIDDVADILAALSLGITLRTIADPGSGVLDHERQRSLLGTAALGLFLGLFQRADSAENLTVEKAVEAMVYGQP